MDAQSSVHEEVPVTPLEDRRFRVLATPGLVQGFAADDVIELSDGGEATTVGRAGNIGVQILAVAHEADKAARLIDDAERLGAGSTGSDRA